MTQNCDKFSFIMQPNLSRKYAFTLVELMVSMILLSMVAGAAYKFFQMAGNTQKTFSQQAILQMQARKAFDQLMDQVHEGSDIVRPLMGETTPFLIFKNIINETVLLYLEPNESASEKLKKRVYNLVSYKSDYSGNYKSDNEKILLSSLRRISFTCLSPNSIQINATVLNERGEFQFLSHVGLMNVGGLE
ncbi:MAG: type II secretion system protein [Candidatus Riflebacteria bacterium]|nr:type II secretion system protein [Candidatus Riflebacteria bacterium]